MKQIDENKNTKNMQKTVSEWFNITETLLNSKLCLSFNCVYLHLIRIGSYCSSPYIKAAILVSSYLLPFYKMD